MHNEVYRELYPPKGEPPHSRVPHLAFMQWKNAFETPELHEGFEEVRTVNFVWEGDEAQRKLWDRYYW
jgi:bifunctional polynucleotide phosphatase/kinase